MKTELKQALLSGNSFAVPLIVAVGTVLAVAVLLAQIFGLQHLFDLENSWLWMHRKLGGGMLGTLMVPVLAAYTAYSLADKPALAPGFAAGLAASMIGSGFLGGVVGGLIAGYLMRWVKKHIRLSPNFNGFLTFYLYPVIGTLHITDKHSGLSYDQVLQLEEGWKEAPIPVWNLLNYAALHDGKNGVALFTDGLREFEIVGERKDTFALKLFRSVGVLGKEKLVLRPGRPSGIKLPTPDSQLRGKLCCRFSLMAFSGSPTAAEIAQDKWSHCHIFVLKPRFYVVFWDFKTAC